MKLEQKNEATEVKLNPIEFNQLLKAIRLSIKQGYLEGWVRVEAARFLADLHYYCQICVDGEEPCKTTRITGIRIDEASIASRQFDLINPYDIIRLELMANEMLEKM